LDFVNIVRTLFACLNQPKIRANRLDRWKMIFGGIGERLEFIHRADSRDTFRPRRSPRRLVGGQAQDVRVLYIGFISTVLQPT
jgi:hypothetical protein